jgi:Fe/S biogenesis protein NfuA
MLTLSETARRKFTEAAAAEGRNGDGLRVIVKHGGTYRPEFALGFVGAADARDDDVISEVSGIRVHMDPESAKWLRDAGIDFIEGPHESGFRVEAPHAGIPRPTGALADAVQAVLDTKVNPAVASHGGHVSLAAVEGDTVYLRFGGGCHGCGMVKATLKDGVERMIFESVPGVARVLDVTDHESGTNPYYPRT